MTDQVYRADAWNVYLSGRRVATVELAEDQVGAFRRRLGDDTADLVRASWDSGTPGTPHQALTIGERSTATRAANAAVFGIK